MGFGYLFVGHLLTFNFTFYGAYTDVFATALMLLGLSTLSLYAKGFRLAFRTGIPLLLLHAVSFVGKVGELLGFFTLPAPFISYTALLDMLLRLVFYWFLLSGVMEISKATDIPVLVVRAFRNRLFTPIFFLLKLVIELDVFTTLSKVLQGFIIAYFLWGLVCTFLNAKLFYECYIWICLEGDEQMERKTSRFGFINRLNAWSDKMDKATLERKREERRIKEERKKNKKN